MREVKINDTIKVHYTGKLDDGKIFDTSSDYQPLQFKVGEGQIIPGFEKGVVGMKLNETKVIRIASEQAYGSINEDLIQEVKIEALPNDLKLEIGQELVSEETEGNQVTFTVTKITDASLTLDANHPLAGKDLTFEIQLIEIL